MSNFFFRLQWVTKTSWALPWEPTSKLRAASLPGLILNHLFALILLENNSIISNCLHFCSKTNWRKIRSWWKKQCFLLYAQEVVFNIHSTLTLYKWTWLFGHSMLVIQYDILPKSLKQLRWTIVIRLLIVAYKKNFISCRRISYFRNDLYYATCYAKQVLKELFLHWINFINLILLAKLWGMNLK